MVESRTCDGEEDMWWRAGHMVERRTCGGEKDVMSQEEEGKKVHEERGGRGLCVQEQEDTLREGQEDRSLGEGAGGHVEGGARRCALGYL